MTLHLPVIKALNLGGSTSIAGISGLIQIKDPLWAHSKVKITLQFERSTRLKARGLRATCPSVFLRIFRDKIDRTSD
jgi:hypothetical protein